MAITSSFANLATVTRASKKTDAGGWDFTNGGTVATLAEYASGVAAIHASSGLLLEPSTTNLIENARCEGSDATWSYLCDRWQLYNLGGFTLTKSNQADDDGWPSVDIKHAITSPSAGVYAEYLFQDRTDVGDGVTSLNGDDYTGSVCVQLVSGSLTNVSKVALRIREFDAGGTAVGSATDVDITADIAAGKKRFKVSRTCSASGVYLGFSIAVVAGGTGNVDVTLRLGAPQLEAKDYATGPVLPVVSTPAATTRAADDVALTLGSWLGASSKTLFIEWCPQRATDGASMLYVVALNNGSSNTIGINVNSSGIVGFLSVSAGAVVVNGNSGQTQTAGASIKAAIAFAANDVAASVTGGTQLLDTSAALPSLTGGELQLNGYTSPTTGIGGYIKDVRFFPRRVSNAELEAMVGN